MASCSFHPCLKLPCLHAFPATNCEPPNFYLPSVASYQVFALSNEKNAASHSPHLSFLLLNWLCTALTSMRCSCWLRDHGSNHDWLQENWDVSFPTSLNRVPRDLQGDVFISVSVKGCTVQTQKRQTA